MPRLIDADAFFNDFPELRDYEYASQNYEVDAEPVRHGHWIEGNSFHWYSNSCSCCGYTRTTDIKSNGWNQWKYCPNCGARMDGERR